jgi:hypothetical protein
MKLASSRRGQMKPAGPGCCDEASLSPADIGESARPGQVRSVVGATPGSLDKAGEPGMGQVER